MQIRNLMQIDYRTRKGRAIRELQRQEDRRKLIHTLISVAVLTFLAFTILAKTIYDATHSKPLSQTKVVEVVQAEEIPQRAFCNDVINCIRDVGEELEVSNKDIMTMVRIAKKESNYNNRAKNKTSSASGVFQIIAGTWYSNDCVGDKWNAEDNIRCAYKIYSKRGFQPWEVCHNGSVNCK